MDEARRQPAQCGHVRAVRGGATWGEWERAIFWPENGADGPPEHFPVSVGR